MKGKPLLVQSDRTLLLDVHSPLSDECRRDIIVFSELLKSPEHIHTYTITPVTLWNSSAMGVGASEIIRRLERWSEYEIDSRVRFYIEDWADRYGEFILQEEDSDTLRLSVKRPYFYSVISHEKSLKHILSPSSDGKSFLLPRLERGTLKSLMIGLGYPVDDRVALKKGAPLSISLRDDVVLRPYQKESADAFFDGGGYGVIVLPCGSGKTVVGMAVMSRLRTRTLILCPNASAVHQWERELGDKTDLSPCDIGEYSGEVKNVRNVTIATYQVLIRHQGDPLSVSSYPHFSLFTEHDWGLIIYDEVHMLPAPVFRITAELQAVHRLGLTATLVREDGREGDVFSLVGPRRYDAPWMELAGKGFIAKAWCHEIRIPLPRELELPYALAKGADKIRTAAMNPLKLDIVKRLLDKHKGEGILIIGQYLEQLEAIRKELGFPLIQGRTPVKKRDALYDAFRSGREKVLIVSKVANFAVDLPDASVAIEVSGTYGSRQEEAQRLGRILRPKDRDSHFYTIVTEYTSEEDYAENRQKFLAEQGYSYSVEKVRDL